LIDIFISQILHKSVKICILHPLTKQQIKAINKPFLAETSGV